MLFSVFTPALAAERDTEFTLQSALLFTDVHSGNWFYAYVRAVYTEDVMNGITPTTFEPQSTFTRAQVIATLFRIQHGRTANQSDPRESGFADVTPANWFAAYATWARTNNIVPGTTFNGNQNALRQEIALFIYRYAANLTDLSSSSAAGAQWGAFADREQISGQEYYNALRWANYKGIVNGINQAGVMRIAPGGTAIRAEAATMLVRLMNLLPERPGGGQGPVALPTLPNRRLTEEERGEWIAAYRALGGPTAVELEVVRLVNIERASHNLSQVEIDEPLMMAARFFGQQAHDLRGLHTGTHNFGPYATDPEARHGASANVAAAFGANLRWNGGNWFSGGSMSAEALVSGWMNSEGHRRFILSPEHRFIGMGQFPGGISYLFLNDTPSRSTEQQPPTPTPQPPANFPTSAITLPNRQLTNEERDAWIAEYQTLGGHHSFELEVVRVINETRVSYGLNTLQINNTLMMAARFYAQTMAQWNRLAHNVGPYGASGEVARAFGFDGLLSACGAQGPLTAQGIVNAWLNSPLHRAIVLSPLDNGQLGMGSHLRVETDVFHYLFITGTPSVPATLEEGLERAGSYSQFREWFPDIPAQELNAIFEQETFRLINIERSNHGLAPLHWDPQLGAAARAHSVDMHTRHFADSICPSGIGPATRASNAGFQASWIGDINSWTIALPRGIVGWEMQFPTSPGRAAILHADATHIGVGLYNHRWVVKIATAQN